MQYNDTRDTMVSCGVHVWSTQWVWPVGGVFSAVHQNSKVLKTQEQMSSQPHQKAVSNDVICVQPVIYLSPAFCQSIGGAALPRETPPPASVDRGG